MNLKQSIVLSYVTLAISWTFIREVIFIILLSPTVMHSYIFVPVYTWISQRWYIFRYNFFYETCSTVHGSKPFPHLKVFWRLSLKCLYRLIFFSSFFFFNLWDIFSYYLLYLIHYNRIFKKNGDLSTKSWIFSRAVWSGKLNKISGNTSLVTVAVTCAIPAGSHGVSSFVFQCM